MLGLKKKKKEKPEVEAAEEGAEGAEEAKEQEAKEPAAEGEEGEAPAESPEDAAKSKKKKLIIIAVGVLMLLIAGGAGAFFVFSGGEEEAEKAKDEQALAAGKPVFFDLPQILVNLNTGGKQASFIKTTVTLELANELDVPAVQANLPRLMDNYNTFLREMRASDLYGSSGAYRLREEMLTRANKLLAPVKVKDVLFRELLVQ